MNIKPYIPTLPEISREALIVLGGALVAALILGQFPAIKKWISDRLPTASVPGG